MILETQLYPDAHVPRPCPGVKAVQYVLLCFELQRLIFVRKPNRRVSMCVSPGEGAEPQLAGKNQAIGGENLAAAAAAAATVRGGESTNISLQHLID